MTISRFLLFLSYLFVYTSVFEASYLFVCLFVCLFDNRIKEGARNCHLKATGVMVLSHEWKRRVLVCTLLGSEPGRIMTGKTGESSSLALIFSFDSRQGEIQSYRTICFAEDRLWQTFNPRKWLLLSDCFVRGPTNLPAPLSLIIVKVVLKVLSRYNAHVLWWLKMPLVISKCRGHKFKSNYIKKSTMCSFSGKIMTTLLRQRSPLSWVKSVWRATQEELKQSAW